MHGSELQQSIQLIAAEIAEGDMEAARILIRKWSAFDDSNGSGARVDIYRLYGDDPWARVSVAWTAIIHRKAKAAYADWQARDRTVPMFADAEVVRAKKRTRKRTSKREWQPEIDQSKQLPEVEDNGSDLPF